MKYKLTVNRARQQLPRCFAGSETEIFRNPETMYGSLVLSASFDNTVVLFTERLMHTHLLALEQKLGESLIFNAQDSRL